MATRRAALILVLGSLASEILASEILVTCDV